MSVAIPAAGFLAGLVLLMVLIRTSLTSVRIWPKVIGAAVILACGLILPFAAASAASAGVLAVLALWMMLSGDAVSQQRATG